MTDVTEFEEWERAAWEQRASCYAASLGDLTKGSIEDLLDAAQVGRGTRVLDVGTGPGFVASVANARSARVVAVDQSYRMVQLARARGVDAVQASATDLPIADGELDAVVGAYVLNHVGRPEVMISQLHRVLRIGGPLALTIWDTAPNNPVTGLLNPIVAALGMTAVVPPGPDACRFCDRVEVDDLLSQWSDVDVRALQWCVRVEPGAWFDALAAATPRTGAVLAQAGAQRRAQARSAYLREATSRHGVDGGHVELPARALLISATK